MIRSLSRLYLMIIAFIFLSLMGCGSAVSVQPSQEDEQPTSSGSSSSSEIQPEDGDVLQPDATNEQDEHSNGAIPANVLLDKPTDLPVQLAYVPGAAGGSGNTMACGTANLPDTDQTPFTYSGEDRPYLFIISDPVDRGGYLTICYFNFTPGVVKERIVNSAGETIISREFTIDEPQNVDANDYMALPDDPPGTYQVIAETPDGQFTTDFMVTDQLFESEFEGPFIRPLGRGPNGEHPQTGDVEIIYFARFEPGDIVDVYFYEYCRPPEGVGVGRWSYNGIFQTGTRLSVNEQGWTFWQIPAEVRDRLNLSLGHYIVAKGMQTAGDGRLGEATGPGPGDVSLLTSPETAFALTWHEENDQTPVCPPVESTPSSDTSGSSGQATPFAYEDADDYRTLEREDTLLGTIDTVDDEDIYSFKADAGHVVTIVMSGQDDLDSYLALIDPEGNRITEDDDSASNRDALIQIPLVQDGTYTIIASSYEASSAGAYELYLSLGAGGGGRFISSGDPEDDTWLHMVDNTSGNINPASDEDTYYFEIQDSQPVRILMWARTNSLDPYLILLAPDGSQVAADDDRGEGNNAFINTVLHQS